MVLLRSICLAILICLASTAPIAVAGECKSLQEAIEAGDANKVRYLLSHGVEVNCRDDHGATPLMDAAYWGRHEIVNILLRRGADVHARDNRGETALDWADFGLEAASVMGYSEAEDDLKEVIRLLRQAGAGY